jgi:hypothetical protein
MTLTCLLRATALSKVFWDEDGSEERGSPNIDFGVDTILKRDGGQGEVRGRGMGTVGCRVGSR